MKNSMLIIGACILAGCAAMKVEKPQWTTSIATDNNAGQIECLDLNGLPLEWSTAEKGHGYLYFSQPETNDKVWAFPGRVATGEHKTGVDVYDGDVVTVVHRSGRKFQIEIMIQTQYYVKVKYKEI